MERGEWRVMISPSPTLPEREGGTSDWYALRSTAIENEKWKMENGEWKIVGVLPHCGLDPQSHPIISLNKHRETE